MEGSTKALWIMVDGGSVKNISYINVMMEVAGSSEMSINLHFLSLKF